ncbi:twin-arginine translocation signal domain-containing protein [Petrimonas sulfuriphila]|uniref:twin-arginine translocation signal domain-containing protein n=1 Tax=Petrimonas sulfuriphila TaxID=285070 RepID=UPI003F514259
MSNQLTRRKFIKSAAVGVVGVTVLPQFLASCNSNKKSGNEKIDDGITRLGFIGLGQQGIGLLGAFLTISGVEVVAGSDVYGIKRERFLKRLNDHYGSQQKNCFSGCL